MGIDAFGDFIKLFKGLSKDETNLVLTLLEDYLYVDANSMLKHFRMIFKSIGEDLIANYYSKVIFVPLRKENSLSTKSQTYALYPAFHALRQLTKNKVTVSSYDRIEALSTKEKNRQGALILLVDDFIGTGDTALKAYEKYNSKYRVDTDDPAILTIACLGSGKQKIQNKNIQLWHSIEQSKGISESSRIQKKLDALEIMKQISSKLRVRPDYYLGYKSSEGLISMSVRTPNNTFPLFWCPKDSSGNEWPAPFYR